MKKLIILFFVALSITNAFAQDFDLNTIKQKGLGGVMQDNAGISPEVIKAMKGKVTITNQYGVKKTLKCAVSVQSNSELAAYMTDEKSKKKLLESDKKGLITISCSDENGENVVIIMGDYRQDEIKEYGFGLQKNVGHMSMHNTFQLPAFGQNGMLTLEKKGSNWKFVGSTEFKTKKGIAVVLFDGEAPVQTTKAPAATAPNMPKRIDPNQAAKDAMKKKPAKGTKLPTKL